MKKHLVVFGVLCGICWLTQSCKQNISDSTIANESVKSATVQDAAKKRLKEYYYGYPDSCVLLSHLKDSISGDSSAIVVGNITLKLRNGTSQTGAFGVFLNRPSGERNAVGNWLLTALSIDGDWLVGTLDNGDKINAVVIGDTLETGMFAVQVNRVYVTDKINTGNPYSALTADKGTIFYVINATVRNTDRESRAIDAGTLYITPADGKTLMFDHTETVLADGYLKVYEQLNPLISKTINVVYSIPMSIRGRALWVPGRSEIRNRVVLGALAD